MEALSAALTSAYGIMVERAERIDYGIWEEPFRVWTDRGPLFAKRFRRKDRQSEQMLRGLHLSQSLRLEHNFPAPQVIPTLHGDLLAEVHGERYQVTEWVDGRSYHPGELPDRAAGPLGATLGRLHRLLGPAPVPPPAPYPSPAEGIQACQALLGRYADRPEPFAKTARQILSAQVELLAVLPPSYHERLPVPALGGPCFNSYWVEQLLFAEEGAVAALVDWTDGAGKPGHWADEIDTALHLSGLNERQVAAFVPGYQAENPLPEREWRAVAATYTYGHLASTNFLAGWLSRPYRRLAEWEVTATVWHTPVPERFRRRADWEALILDAVRR